MEEKFEDFKETLSYMKDEMKQAKASFASMSSKAKLGLRLLVFLLCFLAGVWCASMFGVSNKKYNELDITCRNLGSQLAEANAKLKTFESKSDEYDAYKAKMQPYEAQQTADEEAAKVAAAEKQRLEEEEKAKAAAEAKAKQEAEAAAAAAEKQRAEAELKSKSLGMTKDEFVAKYNIEAANFGADVLYISNKNVSYAPLNSYISFNLLTYRDNSPYLDVVHVNYKNTANDFELAQFTAVCAAAMCAVDSSLNYQGAVNILNDLAVKSVANLGDDVSSSRNGIEYTFNTILGETLFAISK